MVDPNSRNLRRLHLGCGLITPPGWINIDGSWNARLAKHAAIRRALHLLGLLPADKLLVPWKPDVFIHDVRKPLPFAANSASAIYASHLFEHLHFEEGTKLIRECFRVLVRGGILRIVVPDLNAAIREYLGEQPFGTPPEDLSSLKPADRLNQRLLLRSPTPRSGSLFYRLYCSLKDFENHKWMYDADSLTAQFERGGFVEIQAMDLHVSRIDGIEQVEDPSRVLNGAGICIEGVRP